MAHASRLQVRSRVVAAFTAVWLVVCGVLSAQHEARVAHVRTSAGEYTHGSAATGHHEGTHSDIHGQRDPSADHGECALLTAAHQPATPAVAWPSVAATVAATVVLSARRTETAARHAAVYRLAPKTSPPADA